MDASITKPASHSGRHRTLVIEHGVHPADVGGAAVATHVRDLGQGPAQIDGDHDAAGRALAGRALGGRALGGGHDQPVSTTERVRLRGAVGVEAQRQGPGHGDPLHRDELDQRVPVIGDPGRPRGGDVVGETGGRLAEHPDRTVRGGDGDRAVPVVHRRVGLRPAGRRLAELQRRLVGEAHGPTPAEERALLGRGPGGIERRGHGLGGRLGQPFHVAAPGGPEEQQRAGGEPGLDHRLLVGEGQVDHTIGQLGGRRAQITEDDGGRHLTAGVPELIQHLGGRARAGQGDDPVVAPSGRHLRRGEGIGLAEPGGLAPGGGHLTDEPRGSAADQGDALAGLPQGSGQFPGHLDGLTPAIGLGGDLGFDEGHSMLPKCLRLFVLLPKHADMNISCRV